MTWSRDDSGAGRRGYHHGNLREALIRAALDLITEKGPAGFTFADAARSAGVRIGVPAGSFDPMSVHMAPPFVDRNRCPDCSCVPARSVCRFGSVKSTLTESLCVTLPEMITSSKLISTPDSAAPLRYRVP